MIPLDKQAHALAGACLFLLCLVLGAGAQIALGLVALAAVAKEAYDHAHPDVHTCDAWDAFATILPAAIGWLLMVPLQVHPHGLA